MNLINRNQTETVSTIWLANVLVFVLAVVLGTVAFARYFSVI